MNAAWLLTEQARSRPDAAAIIDMRGGRVRCHSFGMMAEESARAATVLSRAGLRAGDVVLVLQPMSAELYIALVALFRLGITAMFLDPSAGLEHISRCCEMTPPGALLMTAKAQILYVGLPALRRIRLRIVIGLALPGSVRWSEIERAEPTERYAECGPEAPALITFTSGSTGRPKAVVRSHGFLLGQLRILGETVGLPCGVVEMPTLPIFALANLAAGLTSVLPDADLRAPGSVRPEPILSQIQAHQVTRITASPAFLERLAEFCIAQGRTLDTITQIFTGGGPVYPGLMERLQAVAPHSQITAVYGSTEAEPIAEAAFSGIAPADRAAMRSGRGLLAGEPVGAIQLRVIEDRWGAPIGPLTPAELEASARAPGEAGEIVVTGEHVLKGYLNGQGDEETKFRAGGEIWHRTGDAGYLDASGRLWLLGRCAAVVRDGRGTLYPFAVECAALEFGTVRRAALLTYRGDRILAIEVRPGGSPDMDQMRSALAWAHLDRIAVVHEIPVDRRHNAKVDYTQLQRQLMKKRHLRNQIH